MSPTSTQPPRPTEPPRSPPLPGGRALLLSMAGLAMLLMFGYALARPATESIFVEHHGTAALPWVWLLVAVASAGAVWLYNRALFRFGLMQLLAILSVASGVAFSLLALAVQLELPLSRYALYLHKELYMLVLIEIYYSYGNSVYPIQLARWAYGFFGIVGASAGIVGHVAVGRIAVAWGSEMVLHLMLPLLLVTAGVALVARRHGGADPRLSPDASDPSAGRTSFVAALGVVRGSAYLGGVLALVALVQLVVTLVDFDFNHLVDQLYPGKDLKTQAMGHVYAAMSTTTVTLHALTGVTLRLLGVPLVLLAVPLLLGATVGGFVLWPIFLFAAAMKVASKALDYTILRAAKEMLYIPLSLEERTQGKALVDVLTYRLAKGVASLLLLGMLQLGVARLTGQLTLGLVACWLVLSVVIGRAFRRQVGRAEELRGPRPT